MGLLEMTVFAVVLTIAVADICGAAIRVGQLDTGESTGTGLFGIDVTAHHGVRVVAGAIWVEGICWVDGIAHLIRSAPRLSTEEQIHGAIATGFVPKKTLFTEDGIEQIVQRAGPTVRLVIFVALTSWYIAKFTNLTIQLSVSTTIGLTNLSGSVARITRKAIIVIFATGLTRIFRAAILFDVTVIRGQAIDISTFIFKTELAFSALCRVCTGTALFCFFRDFSTGQCGTYGE